MIVPQPFPVDFDSWSAERQRAFVLGFNQGMERMQISICDAMMRSAERPEFAALSAPMAMHVLAAAYDQSFARLVTPGSAEA